MATRMRDLNLARQAFDKQDPELSRAVHAKKVYSASTSVGRSGGGHQHGGLEGSTEEGHQPQGAMIKSVVFGGLDGILTTFAVVSGAVGGNLTARSILILGFAGAVGEGLAMGLGDALSSKAETEHVLHERNREFWEYDHYLEGEKQEMVQLYQDKGMSRTDAVTLVDLIAPHRGFFVDVMTMEELGLNLPDPDDNPWKDGFVTFASFVFFAGFPLLAFSILPVISPASTMQHQFALACVVTALSLFALGALKSIFSTKSWYRSGFEIVALGTAVAFLAYVIGAVTAIYVQQYEDHFV